MNRMRLIFLVSGLAIMGAGAGFIAWLRAAQELGQPGVRVVELPGTNRLDIAFPETALGRPLKRVPPTEMEMAMMPDDTSLGRAVFEAGDGFGCAISVVLMGTDRTSLHRPQICLTGQGWRLDLAESQDTSIKIDRPHAYELPVRRLLGTKQVETENGLETFRAVFVYWFVADEAITNQDWERMLWMANGLMTRGVLQRWAYVAYYSYCRPGQEEETWRRMSELVADTVPEFQIATRPGGEGQ